jgi:DNA invertase Pin-like site-specific DNA recombinase
MMNTHELLPTDVLRRTAVVYVRQSTQTQVMVNLESQRRQYDLVEEARRRGFLQVEVIDDDLGRSASGTVARSGFDRLVASLCAGEVGAVFCMDASRLARNGRDWHHLLELCGLVDARVIDTDGVYNPCRPNDRLLLGMKGSISEFELGVLRSRMLDAARAKAKRGELRLELQVVDRDMGDEIRSTASLSGGGTFLVSLARALGLSSLASEEVRIESLFIDEGFGSLDPKTLETALSTLDSIQSAGRKVGLISHVPGLAERIGVQVLVERQGQGASTVRVVGGGV